MFYRNNVMQSVDVLIPFFNDVEGFEKTLTSISLQGCKDKIKIVLADDGSERENFYTIQKLLDRSGITHRIVRSEVNRGRPYTRNCLLDNMESDYVAWLDAGDEWFPEKIELQLKALHAHEADASTHDIWVTCDYEWREAGKEPRIVAQQTEGDLTEALLRGRRLRGYLWTILAPRLAMENVGYFDEELPRLQDLDFFIRFTLKRGRIVKPERLEPLCAYNKNRIGRDARQVEACFDHLMKKYAYLYARYGRKFRVSCARHAKKNCAKFAEANGDLDFARELRRQARRMKIGYYFGASA